MIFPLTRAHLTALIAYILFTVSIFIDIRLAPIPLILFIAVCVAASFFPRPGYYLPVVSGGKREGNGVALTFDDGPDPRVTPLLLDLLDLHGVTATFFVTGAKAERHPDIVREIIARGHTVGNHSFGHSPRLMLKGREELRRELEAAQLLFKEMGVVPLAFRPPYGITGPRLWRVLLELGLFCVGPGCRGCAKRGHIAGAAERLLDKVAPGDILTLPDTVPEQGVELLLKEVATLMDGIHGKGLEIVSLGRLIGRETMLRPESGCGTRPVELFYNDLAPAYDLEQFSTAVSMSKRKEYELFLARLPALCTGTERVLEIGAGTGIFTIPLARRCREVVAVDISRNMLALLEKKAAVDGLDNIRTLLCDAETIPLDGTFSLICAFASLEYMSDLPALVQRLARHIEPEGTIYFITARRSFLRFFVQLGNAMRQGIWLKARGRREIRRILGDAGFAQVDISTHLFKVWHWGGMLMEVAGRRSARREAPAQVAAGPAAPLRTLLLAPLWRPGRPLSPLVECAAAQGLPVLLVEAGGDDGEAAACALPVERLRLAPGAGERDALWAAAALAKEKGYGALLILDEDAEIEPADLRLLLDTACGSWPAIMLGTGGSGAGARGGGLSAFLARLECGQAIPDTG
ncbi:MAG TPA: polysaccharide deacetylase family protein, partial [Geobacteraceae bacterium]